MSVVHTIDDFKPSERLQYSGNDSCRFRFSLSCVRYSKCYEGVNKGTVSFWTLNTPCSARQTRQPNRLLPFQIFCHSRRDTCLRQDILPTTGSPAMATIDFPCALIVRPPYGPYFISAGGKYPCIFWAYAYNPRVTKTFVKLHTLQTLYPTRLKRLVRRTRS